MHKFIQLWIIECHAKNLHVCVITIINYDVSNLQELEPA